ncbi:putative zinc finger/helix-turn-helix YgiT family protein [Desulfitispora alkaliphila]|uniref:type II TA system antitoxin MqsA family protein n=1 Tax=Desulfitispora alkaliphila TaxID=622674 RepID=UPI003D1D6DAF
MTNDYLIKSAEMDCPICNKVHSLELRKRLTQGLVKGEVVNYEEVYYLCPLSDEEENEFVPAGLMDENLLRARDAYRIQKGLLTSNEIAEIRSFYGLTQSDLSALLGWGDVTVTRYESKTVQDETYDNIMRMAFENPMFALENLDRHKERFTEDRYKRIRKKITDKVEEVGNLYLKKQEINSLYVNFQEESDYNGFKKLDIEKLANIIGYFAHFANNVFKVKLMKLLWYADALHFRRYGRSMTGLVYKHRPYGALPIAFDEIIYLPTVRVIEEIIYEDISYKIVPNKQVNVSDFSLEELNILESVATKFKNYRAREIVNYMHEEKAYLETEEYEIIPYSLAKELRELR